MLPQDLTGMEYFCKYVVGFPFLPFDLATVNTIPPRHHGVITSFGKYSRTISTGLYWLPWLGTDIKLVFVGPQTFQLNDMKILDAVGNPIQVSAVINYCISDAALFSIKYDKNTDYIHNTSSTVVRECVSKYTYDNLISGQQANETVQMTLQTKFKEIGAEIISCHLSEIKYAPEIAASMLVKQGAHAYVQARQTIVEGLVTTIREVIKEFPELSAQYKEILITTLLPVLASGQSVQPTLQVNAK